MASGILIGHTTSSLEKHSLGFLAPILLTMTLACFQGCDYRVVELNESTNLFESRYYSRHLFELLTLGSLFCGLIIQLLWTSRLPLIDSFLLFLLSAILLVSFRTEISAGFSQRREPLTVLAFVYFFRVLLELLLDPKSRHFSSIFSSLLLWFLQSANFISLLIIASALSNAIFENNYSTKKSAKAVFGFYFIILTLALLILVFLS